jgi:hypothetical protein
MIIRPDHPDFLDLRWDRSITEWDHERLVVLPTGIHRHEIVFVAYRNGIYAIKELPLRVARHEYEALRELERLGVPSVTPVGIVERPWVDPTYEHSAAVITGYVNFAFPFRELVSGTDFGARRNQMSDALAGLLMELHLAGCFWGDCSLSNVLYRYDAAALEAIMIDGETVELHAHLTDGQREEDLEIMVVNVAGGMADLAASEGKDLDDADLFLGEDIAERYRALWAEIITDELIGPDERFRISDRVRRINDLGFEVDDVELMPEAGGDRLKVRVKVGSRSFHATKLRELTRIDASENQAREILSDLHYYEAANPVNTPSGKAIAAIQWRVAVFEPMLARIVAAVGPTADPVQRYCDFLHHRYILATRAGQDVGNEAAFDDWVAAGFPGYPLG